MQEIVRRSETNIFLYVCQLRMYKLAVLYASLLILSLKFGATSASRRAQASFPDKRSKNKMRNEEASTSAARSPPPSTAAVATRAPEPQRMINSLLNASRRVAQTNLLQRAAQDSRRLALQHCDFLDAAKREGYLCSAARHAMRAATYTGMTFVCSDASQLMSNGRRSARENQN